MLKSFKRFHSSSTRIKPLNVAYFGSDIFSLRILEHLSSLIRRSNSPIQHLEVVTTNSSSNTIRNCAEKLEIPTHTWPNLDPIQSNPNLRFDLGILASFGQLIPRKLIEAFPL